jgi:hypothetical protein
LGGRPGRPTEVDSGRTDGRDRGDTRSTRMRSTALRGFWAIRVVGMAASTGSQITPFAIHSTQVSPDPGIGEGDSTKYRGPSAIFSSSPRDWSGRGRWASSCREISFQPVESKPISLAQNPPPTHDLPRRGDFSQPGVAASAATPGQRPPRATSTL